MRKHKVVFNDTLKQEFQKDLELFNYFLLLLNNSSPIRNVELMWADELDSQNPIFKERVNTSEALVQLQPAAGTSPNRSSPSTLFCDLVHGFGAHEEETCAKSDVPAKQRCRATECSQVYPCHIGLTDIAVPVICDGDYLGTLFSGQVLLQPPTAEGFERVKRQLGRHTHIDFNQLEPAYYGVPVVTDAQLSEMVRVLELFARYIANSWRRLEIMSDLQRVESRELALNRKELAARLLSGQVGEGHQVKRLAAEAGLRRMPNWVLVLRMKDELEMIGANSPVLEHIAINRVAHVVEDLSHNWPDTLSLTSLPGELCIFATLDSRNASHQRICLQERADLILETIRNQGMAGARIGIGSGPAEPETLLRTYQEACAALDTADGAVCFFEAEVAPKAGPGQSLVPVIKALREGERLDGSVRSFLANVIPKDAGPDQLQQSRALLTWAVEHLALEMTEVGIDARSIGGRKDRTIAEILNSSSPFAFCESFRRFTEFLSQQVTTTFSQRESKIVLTVSRLVESRGAASVTIQYLASALRLSPGHLSRVYRRTTGTTLEEYLIRQRIEAAKRMLLDPRLNVAEVSERSGFCNPAYFASVFKKYVHCTPREFATQPAAWMSLTPSTLERETAMPRAGA